MAKATPKLINALRNAAYKINSGAPYQWGHMGSCNCGHLAQEITSLSKGEIHEYAMRKSGDWNDQVMDYCSESSMPMDLLISELLQAGLTIEDLKNLEKLSDPEILRQIPADHKPLLKNKKDHVVLYMKTWANLLEEQWASGVATPSIDKKSTLINGMV